MNGDDSPALFGVEELAADESRMGRVEAGLLRALRAGEEAGTLVPEDAGLIGAALAGARVWDGVERIADPKARAYAAAAIMSPYRECLQALRLPAAVTPSDPRAPAANTAGAPSWLSDLGTPSAD